MNMEMDQNNNIASPVQERSRSSENTDIFDFKNLRNCLPITNHKSGRIADYVQNIGRAIQRLMKIKALINCREKGFTYRRSASLENASISHNTEKNPERLHEESLERIAFPCKVSKRQENSSKAFHLLISDGSLMNSKMQTYFEQKRAECQKNVSLLREKDRLKRACYSRGLSIENMNEPEIVPHQQKKNHSYASLVNDISVEKKKIQKEIEEATRLIQILKEQERQLAML